MREHHPKLIVVFPHIAGSIGLEPTPCKHYRAFGGLIPDVRLRRLGLGCLFGKWDTIESIVSCFILIFLVKSSIIKI